MLLFLLAGCPSHSAVPDGAPPDGGGVSDARFGYECFTLCYRPGDCQVAYPDDDICPAGFLCGRTFLCVSDGGSGD